MHVLFFAFVFTAEQEETWDADLNQYVLEEGDDSFEYSLRLSAQQVLREFVCVHYLCAHQPS
eukprot:COSAG05_NODE_9466_length_622_cov_0.889101_1_plen_62_part_00